MSTRPSSCVTERYRPQFHFTPKRNWMNDPNGLLYHNGIYHLYYQYNPASHDWGNMSWGHATSPDLIHWEEQPVALLARGYPGEVSEMFFSGSAVADPENTSGFSIAGQIPLIAMYTSFYPKATTLPSGRTVEAGTQAQSIAYSLDDGYSWQKCEECNPVIPLPPPQYADQYENHRDPFVFWYTPERKWVAVTVLAWLHKMLIWTSSDLKEWAFASEFGPANATGGEWECPSLYPLMLAGAEKWIVMIGLNPGGPPGVLGSGTQYFVGTFDGTRFVADAASVHAASSDSAPKVESANWVDYGPDFYAAVLFNGLPADQSTSMAWMANWQYLRTSPTYPWRGAMSTPRQMSLGVLNGKNILLQAPRLNQASNQTSVSAFNKSWVSLPVGRQYLGISGRELDITLSFGSKARGTCETPRLGLILRPSPDGSHKTVVGYDFASGRMFVDRTTSGDSSFDPSFASIYYAPLSPGTDGRVTMRILLDRSSVEVFGGQGESTITAQIFPNHDGDRIALFSEDASVSDVRISLTPVASSWP